MHIHVIRTSSENGRQGRWMDREGRESEEKQNKKGTSIIEIGRGGVPRMKLRLGTDFNFKCKSASRWHEGAGGMKVPAIVLIRMRISIGIVLRYRRDLGPALRDAASLVIVKMQRDAHAIAAIPSCRSW